MPDPSASAAKSRVMQARMQLESGRGDDVDATLEAAEGFLDGLPDDEAAPIRADIATLRGELGGPPPEPDPPAVEPPPPEPAPAIAAASPDPAPVATGPAGELSDDDHANLSRAKSRIFQARQLVESGQTERAVDVLDEAEGFLDDVPSPATEALRADLAAARSEASGAGDDEALRRLTDELDRHVRAGEGDIGLNARTAADGFDRAEARLGEPDARELLDAAATTRYRDDIVAGRARLAASVKAEGLRRAEPLLAELEAGVATDPFVGLDQMAAYRVTNDLQTLEARIRAALHDVPADDDAVLAIEGRVRAVDRAMEAASTAWGQAAVDAAVESSWAIVEQAVAGWEDEVALEPRPLEEPVLPLTRLAIQRIGAWLFDPETVARRAEHAGEESTYVEAERQLAEAARRFDVAFDAVLTAAEAMPTPLRRLELDRPNMLAVGAEYAFARTPYLEANVARARALDDRWKAEFAAIMRARQELFDQLSEAATAAWPAIVAAVEPQEGLDPTTAAPGTTFVLRGVYNREGWDFTTDDTDLCLRVDGTPIAGPYEPRVLAALEHAWYELKLDVSDWLPWDLIGVVEGPGVVQERTIVILRNRDTNLEIGRIDELRPVPALRIRVVGLRAGPVAVGPA